MRYDHISIKYLGCPIYNGRKLLEIFIDLICKITNRIKGWHLKLLSIRGIATLIRHVLFALNVHTLAAVHPPKGTLEVIERGNSNFWFDKWNEHDLLYELLENTLIYQHIPIKDVFQRGHWNWNALNPQPPDHIKHIITSFNINLVNNIDDIPLWAVVESGKFSVSSVWKLLRKMRPFAFIDAKIWHKHILYKMSCVTWRAIHNRMPTDDKIVDKFKITIVSKCVCCIATGMNPGLESSEHLFCKGDYAQRIWSSIIGRLGIITRHTNLRELLQRCWNSTSKNPVAKYALSIIPPIIVWELWRSMCNSRYEEEIPFTKRSIFMIAFKIFHLNKKIFTNINLPENWESLLKLMEIQLEDTIHIMVKWSRPSHHSMKLNDDGYCIRESSRGGGVVRNSNGNYIMAFILPLGNGTSNTVEAKVFLFGLKWCIANEHIFTIVEIDSLILLNSILNLWSTPWRIRETVDEIKELILKHNIQINHCYREANRVADKLASYSHLTNTSIILTDTSGLSAHVKGLLNLDKWQFPSFRIKKKRSIP
ncbi:hypothetical protein RDI58_019326 [Solanum bulbocastanum]|uniref:RNase H type-1 domain-containing protein n=1 Tax=Solanum bulbocastanum TaxID=147425 RepID=A0AAN8T6I0_SOLBU